MKKGVDISVGVWYYNEAVADAVAKNRKLDNWIIDNIPENSLRIIQNGIMKMMQT